MKENENYRTTRGYELQSKVGSCLTSSMEDYLEMIYRLCHDTPLVHVSDISQNLQVKPSSVSKMNRKLKLLGFIHPEQTEGIRLTEKGRVIAEYLLQRHDVVEEFLLFLGNKEPLQETELLEHTVTPDTVERLRGLLSFFYQNPDIYERYCSYIQQ